MAATFGWLCVETLMLAISKVAKTLRQPPSGGCVLKLLLGYPLFCQARAATFGWLCVET